MNRTERPKLGQDPRKHTFAWKPDRKLARAEDDAQRRQEENRSEEDEVKDEAEAEDEARDDVGAARNLSPDAQETPA